MRSYWIFQLKVWKNWENWEKQQKVATLLLFDHSEQACLVFILKQNIIHETTKSKDI